MWSSSLDENETTNDILYNMSTPQIGKMPRVPQITTLQESAATSAEYHQKEANYQEDVVINEVHFKMTKKTKQPRIKFRETQVCVKKKRNLFLLLLFSAYKAYKIN